MKSNERRKNTKHKHLKHQKEEAAGESGVVVLRNVKLQYVSIVTALCFIFKILILMFALIELVQSAGKSRGNAFVNVVGGPRFKFWACQIERSVAKNSAPVRHFFQKSYVAPAQRRGDGPCKHTVTRFDIIQRV